MPYLTPQQKTLLATELAKVAYSGSSDQHACDLLNTPSTITSTVPAPFSMASFMSLLDTTTQGNIMKLPIAGEIIAAVNAQDRSNLGLYLQFLVGQGIVNSTQQTQLGALLTATTTTSSIGPTPFQAISGLGNVAITDPSGRISTGTCFVEYVTEARS